jgi:hypothetical protein
MKLDHAICSDVLLDPLNIIHITGIENRWRDGSSDHSPQLVELKEHNPGKAEPMVMPAAAVGVSRQLSRFTKKVFETLARVLLLTSIAVSITGASAEHTQARFDDFHFAPSGEASTANKETWLPHPVGPTALRPPQPEPQSFFSEATEVIENTDVPGCTDCSFCSRETALNPHNEHEANLLSELAGEAYLNFIVTPEQASGAERTEEAKSSQTEVQQCPKALSSISEESAKEESGEGSGLTPMPILNVQLHSANGYTGPKSWYRALIDTGSTYNLLNQTTAMKLTGTSLSELQRLSSKRGYAMPRLKMADGRMQSALAALDYKIVTESGRTEARTFFVFQNLPVDVIIGATTCSELAACLDWKTRTWNVNSDTGGRLSAGFVVEDCVYWRAAVAMRATESVTIPPHSHTLVSVACNDLPNHGWAGKGFGLTCPAQKHSTMKVATALVLAATLVAGHSEWV